MSEPRRILFIRRDNIGDLVLTTPLIHAVRTRFPAAWIGVLGNTYNTPVLAAHPDIDEVFGYDKFKHQPHRSRLSVYWQTTRLLFGLRSRRIDLAILAGPGAQRHAARLATWLRPRAILGFSVDGEPAEVTQPVPYGAGALLHEAEDVFRLGTALGIAPAAGSCLIRPNLQQLARVQEALAGFTRPGARIVALHISARRKPQRWPASRFASLVRDLCSRGDVTVLLLWSPGTADDPRHPGDDAKAAEILSLAHAAQNCLPWPTATLGELSGAIAACQLMVCADGGAMHMAAGLGVPIIAMFGDSPVRRWRPWGVPHEVLLAPDGDVANLAEQEVLLACERLLARADSGRPAQP